MPINMAAPEVKPPNPGRVSVTRGLEGQDDNIDLLGQYFKEMQKSTVETSMPDDFLSFAACAHYFGVIIFEGGAPTEDYGEEDAEGEPEEDSEAVSESAYPASSAATSPPASTASSTFSIIDPERAGSEEPLDEIYSAFARLSEQDKVLKWREAFMAKIEEDDSEPILPPMQPFGIGLGEDHEELYDGKGKDRASEPGIFSIPQERSNTFGPTSTNEDPDSFINWPDDMLDDNDIKAYEGTSGTNTYLSLDMDIYKPIEAVVVDKEFGREFLEPEQYDTPLPELPEIQPDPKLQAMIYDSAIRYRDELRARRIAEYERKKARQARQATAPLPGFVRATGAPVPPEDPPNPKQPQPIGLVYLWTSQTFEDPLHIGECSLGFYIAPAHRKKENLVDPLNAVVKQAFQDRQCHRLQAIVVETDDKLFTLELLTASGFRQEGTRRRAFFSPLAQEWKDVTYFAMLATEWVYDNNSDPSSVRLRTATLWDEILTRHQREFDELHRLEEKTLKRSNSIETIKQTVNDATTIVDSTPSVSRGSITDTSTSASPGPGASIPKRKKLILGAVAQARNRQGPTSYGSGSNISNLDSVPPTSPPVSPKSPVRARYETSIPSSSSPTKFRQRSVGASSLSSPSIGSSASSQWDLLDEEIRNSEPKL